MASEHSDHTHVEVEGSNNVDLTNAAARISQLRASALKEYSLKNYAAAAEHYSEATELQVALHGEMDPQNADIFYYYGRTLYHVAVSKSDALGGKVAGNGEPQKKKRRTDNSNANGSKDSSSYEPAIKAEGVANGDKSYFQITGDENWTDSEDEDDDDEDGDDENEGENADDEDDFANAYEVLDMSRVLINKQIEAFDAQQAEQETSTMDKGKGPSITLESFPAGKRALLERLADTQDLQAEIWLESERFHDAIPDFEAALQLKLRLYPSESSLIAEAHYKLALALEFASIRKAAPDEDATPQDKTANGSNQSNDKEAEPEVNEEMRQEAARHMTEAIKSCELRVEKERTALSHDGGVGLSEKEKEAKQKNIEDVKEMINDLTQRVCINLYHPP